MLDSLPAAETTEELSVREGYAAWASTYDDDGNPLIALEGPAVREWFGPLEGCRALDIGCGTGRHTLALLDVGAHVTALDSTPEMLNRASEKLHGHQVAWIYHTLPARLPFPNASFEIAVLGLVLEHVEELAESFDEVARVLVPGGLCIASALHPDRTAEGQRARFIDPETGLRRPIRTIHRSTDDYLGAAKQAGLILEGEQNLVVSAELGDRLQRAARYVGKKLGWVGCWRKPG